MISIDRVLKFEERAGLDEEIKRGELEDVSLAFEDHLDKLDSVESDLTEVIEVEVFFDVVDRAQELLVIFEVLEDIDDQGILALFKLVGFEVFFELGFENGTLLLAESRGEQHFPEVFEIVFVLRLGGVTRLDGVEHI